MTRHRTTRLVDGGDGLRLHLRGIFARIVEPGALAVGGLVAKP